MRERFPPDCAFRGRARHTLQLAVPAEPRGRTEPDLIDEVAWWQTDDSWQYALFTAVAYMRAAANRQARTCPQVCQELAQLPGPPG
jgi:hypothetical protein